MALKRAMVLAVLVTASVGGCIGEESIHFGGSCGHSDGGAGAACNPIRITITADAGGTRHTLDVEVFAVSFFPIYLLLADTSGNTWLVQAITHQDDGTHPFDATVPTGTYVIIASSDRGNTSGGASMSGRFSVSPTGITERDGPLPGSDIVAFHQETSTAIVWPGSSGTFALQSKRGGQWTTEWTGHLDEWWLRTFQIDPGPANLQIKLVER